MSAAYETTPIRGLKLQTYRERLMRIRPVHNLYGCVDRRQRGSEGDIARALRTRLVVRAWVGDGLMGLARALSDGHLSAWVEDVVIHERVEEPAWETGSWPGCCNKPVTSRLRSCSARLFPLGSWVKRAAAFPSWWERTDGHAGNSVADRS
jgi:hypothetical protein